MTKAHANNSMSETNVKILYNKLLYRLCYLIVNKIKYLVLATPTQP